MLTFAFNQAKIDNSCEQIQIIMDLFSAFLCYFIVLNGDISEN